MGSLNIYQRINAVMRDVEYVQKDSNVSAGAGGNYKAVSHDMVVAVLRKSLVKNGIVVRTDCLRSYIIQEKAPKGEKGFTMHLYSGDYAIHFVNIDNPDDCVSVTVNAHANDSGDKAPGKALSYAVKFAMLKTFSLETGEDDEQRFSDPYTAEQAAVYHDLLENDKAYEFYLFIATLPPETNIGLVNSFPEGKKTQGRKKAQKMEHDGLNQFIAVVEDVQQRLANQDLSVTEITDEMTAVEKKLLMSRLSEYEVQQLSRIKKAQAA